MLMLLMHSDGEVWVVEIVLMWRLMKCAHFGLRGCLPLSAGLDVPKSDIYYAE